MLQREDPCIYITDQELNKFMECLGGNFFKSEQLAQAENVFDLNIKKHRKLEDMFIWFYTKILLKKVFDEVDIFSNDRDLFFKSAHYFYDETFTYGWKKLPLTNNILQMLSLLFFSWERK